MANIGGPCCTHTRVKYEKRAHEQKTEVAYATISLGTTYTDHWVCEHCGTEFVPIIMLKAAEAVVEAVRNYIALREAVKDFDCAKEE